MRRTHGIPPSLHDRTTHWVAAFVLTFVVALSLLQLGGAALAQDADATPSTEADGGYYYTVQPGDSWTTVAKRTGVSIRELQAANPQSLRANRWLRSGEKLLVPVAAADAPALETPAPGATPTAEAEPLAEQTFHVVKGGESWNSIAKLYDVPARLLRAANPRAVRDDLVLYRGERLLIPPVGEGGETTLMGGEETPQPPPPTPSPTPTFPPVPKDSEPEATATVAPTDEPTPTETATTEPTATATSTPETAIGIACPAVFGGYPSQINAILNDPELGIDALGTYFDDCGSSVADGLLLQDLNGDGADELLVIYADPTAPDTAPAGEMIVYAYDDSGFVESFRARASGRVKLLELGDINNDAQLDIVYLDTTCGASTCFDTVGIRSWDGLGWVEWTMEPITMAYSEIEISDSTEEGQGAEVLLRGGVYGSAGAGPQRARTEIWGSVAGQPYSLLEEVDDDSDCLYFAVLDANEAFLDLPNTDLTDLERLYTKAATDPNLTTCWNRPDEDAELRSFSLFRLGLVAAYQGFPEISGDLFASISAIYTNSVYAEAGEVWTETFASTQSIPQACAAVNAWAADNPVAYEYLADYGYANPTFGPADVCPVLDVEASSQGELSLAAPTPLPPTALPAAPAEAPVTNGELPDCPGSLVDYTGALMRVLDVTGADASAVEEWLTSCDAMTDTRGAVATGDFNADGSTDVLILPVVVSDLGFGPNGTQGAVFVYHNNGEGRFDLAYSPDIYGKSNLLAVEDLNGDGSQDLAWTIVGCSTFCVTEVQVVSWNAEESEYATIVRPGATLAEGDASFAPVSAGEPGSGMTLVLTGGVSGTPEGGLEVPHNERWQSIAGAPFQRIAWSYDRDSEGSDCLGLRLIEADAALQAAPITGYDKAIALYKAAFDADLLPCSIFGIAGSEEMIYLQGLASFRTVQAQALGGDAADAEATLVALTQGQPDGAYTQAATKWLESFTETGDPEAACESAQPFFEANEQTWQITDHFGYNHPALAAEQLCFVPAELSTEG